MYMGLNKNSNGLFRPAKRNELQMDLPELAADFRGYNLIWRLRIQRIFRLQLLSVITTRNIPVEGAPDITLNLSEDQRQPKLSSYNQTMLGGQMRSFQKGWYTGRPG